MARLQPDAIRQRLAAARNDAGLTQPDLAALLHVTTDTVQNYEGSRAGGKPPYDRLNDYADFTGKSIKWLLWGDDDEPELQERVAHIEEQQAEIGEILKRLLPDDREPMSMEAATIMITQLERLKAQIEEWSQWMARDQIGKREFDRPKRRDARAKDHPAPPEEAVG